MFITTLMEQQKPQKHSYNHIDYKDTELLGRYLNPHGRIISRRRSGLTAASQRLLANAIKRARFMGFIPYIER